MRTSEYLKEIDAIYERAIRSKREGGSRYNPGHAENSFFFLLGPDRARVMRLFSLHLAQGR